MGTTNSTRKELNKGYIVDGGGITDYANHIIVNTGNQPDSEGKNKNGKYVSGKVKNMTYTLEDKNVQGKFEETAEVINYYDVMHFASTGKYIYGHPDKWVFDSDQKYNNCGIVSALNVLSMAGKINVVAPTAEEITAMTQPKTKTVTDLEGNTTTKTYTPKVDFSSSEEAITLYAIKKHYCSGSYDSNSYSSAKDIKKEDGGSYFYNVNQERRLYHDSMKDINALLADYGVKSDTFLLKMYLQCSSSFSADDEKTLQEEKKTITVKDPETGESKEVEQETNETWRIYKDHSIYYDEEGYQKMNLVVDSTNGNDTIHFEDLSLSDIQKEYYTFVKKGSSLIINYNETNYVEIKNAYNPEPKEHTHIRKITFGSGDSYEEYSLSDFTSHGLGHVYSSTALETPTRKYGYFVRELASLIKEGKGIILQGMATEGFAKAASAGNPNHAITLVGVSYKDYSSDVHDIDGFYVVESGHHLDSAATGAQWISCDQLYNFMSNSLFLTSENLSDFGYAGESRHIDAVYISTIDCIKDWADNLNIIGNERRNTLIGNDGNNILKGGNSVDNLYGGKGNDKLYGGNGNDWLYGGGSPYGKYNEKSNTIVFGNEKGDNTLYGGSGNDTYIFSNLNRKIVYKTDVNGNYILDENNQPIPVMDDDDNICYEEEENHDIIIPGSGKDYLRFERQYAVKLDGAGNRITDDDGNVIKEYYTEELNENDFEYYNDNGNLVIRYDFYSKLNDKGEFVRGYNTATVKDYFKKGLYSNIAWLDDDSTIAQRQADDKNHAYKFLSIMNSSEIKYDIDKTISNDILGSKFNDTITTGNHNDIIKAGAGNDVITPGAGDNTIRAGAGNDVINIGYGNNKIYLDSGKNKIVYDGNISGNDTIYSGKDTDYIEFLSQKTKNDLSYSRKGNNLVIYYDLGSSANNRGTGSSITIMDYFKNPAKCSVKEIRLLKGYIADDLGNIIQENNNYITYTGNFYKKIDDDTYEESIDGTFIKNEDGTYSEVTRYSIDWDTISLANGISAGSEKNLDKTGGTQSGLGNDILSGANGADNIFTFNTKYDGVDTIKTQKTGSITVDLSSTSITRNNNIGFNGVNIERYNFGEKTYAYSKKGNDLIINYGLELENESLSKIILQNYFKSDVTKLAHTLKIGEDTFDLHNALVYFEGLQNSKNTITGSRQDDLIIGGKLADIIKAGAGNDIIYSGKGNDTITGGAGKNEVHYKFGDGSNTITLSKNENLSLYLETEDGNEFKPENIEFSFDKKGNLLINYENETILTIKNFKTKDSTGTNGSINLFVDNALVLNFKDDIFTTKYDSFSKKKASYSGKYYSEFIDASRMVGAVNNKGKGVTIKAGGGDDIVIGSDYNDTIKGGTGNDLIVAGNGKNNVDGGAGDDRYYLFYDDSLNDSNEMKSNGKDSYEENTTIKDTGAVQLYGEDGKTKLKDDQGNLLKDYGNDTAFIFAKNENLELWFNIDDKGNILYNKDKKGNNLGTLTYYIKTSDGKNSATVTGVENFVDKDNKVYSKIEEVASRVGNWLNGKYQNTVEAMAKASESEIEYLYKLFRMGWGENYENPTYDGFNKDNSIYSGKWYSETIDASKFSYTERNEVGKIIDADKEAEAAAQYKNKGVSINASGGDDIITGSIYNDTLKGGSGSDTFVFNGAVGDDVIVDGEFADTIKFSGNPNLSYENKDGKLVITNGSSTVTVGNFDFSATTQKKNEDGDFINATTNIDNIKTSNGTISILNDAEINVKLTDGKIFKATDYAEIITGIGSVSNLSSGINDDKIKMKNLDNVVYSRKNNEGLIISDGENKITITDFDFDDENFNIKITDGKDTETTDDIDLNVDLDDGAKYNATKHKEIIIANGSATIYRVVKDSTGSDIINLTSEDIIKINGTSTPSFSRTDENLIISFKNSNDVTKSVTINNFDFFNGPASNFDKVQFLNSENSYSIKNQEIAYQMAGDTYDSKEYNEDGTETGRINQYKELYYGYGTLKNFDNANDRIRFASTKNGTPDDDNNRTTVQFDRTDDSKDLIATYTEKKGTNSTSYSMTFSNFFENTANNDIKYLLGANNTELSTENMILNVALSESSSSEDQKIYNATKYSEIITGTGAVTGLDSNDKLSFKSTTTCAIDNNILKIYDDTNSITINEFGTNKNLKIMEKGKDINLSSKTLYVTNTGGTFSGADSAFGNIDILGTIGGDQYTGTSGNDIICGSDGNNTLNGADGSDEYYIFYKEGRNSTTLTEQENTTINDSGSGTSGEDKVFINSSKDTLSVIYDAGKNGSYTNQEIEIRLGENNIARITNVEKIITNDGKYFNYRSENLKNDIANWFNAEGHDIYSSVSEVMSSDMPNDISSLQAIFMKDEYWVNYPQ